LHVFIFCVYYIQISSYVLIMYIFAMFDSFIT